MQIPLAGRLPYYWGCQSLSELLDAVRQACACLGPACAFSPARDRHCCCMGQGITLSQGKASAVRQRAALLECLTTPQQWPAPPRPCPGAGRPGGGHSRRGGGVPRAAGGRQGGAGALGGADEGGAGEGPQRGSAGLPGGCRAGGKRGRLGCTLADPGISSSVQRVPMQQECRLVCTPPAFAAWLSPHLYPSDAGAHRCGRLGARPAHQAA